MSHVDNAKSLMEGILQSFLRTQGDVLDVLEHPNHHAMREQLRDTVQAMSERERKEFGRWLKMRD